MTNSPDSAPRTQHPVLSSSPLISAIIIFFNADRFLQEAIQSILAQTCSNWELLLVDDGSTDNSAAIAQRYARCQPHRIRYLQHPDHENHGMSASRNLGIQHSRGRFISFLDADDLWLPAKLQEQSDLLLTHPEVAYVYGPLQIWFGWTGRPEDITRDFIQDIGVPPDTVLQPPRLLTTFLRDDRHIPSGIMVRREIFDRLGFYEEQFRGMFEDCVFHSKVAMQFPVLAAGTVWYRYRQHPESCDATAVRRGEHLEARLHFLQWLQQYLLSHHLNHGDAWHVLQQQLRPYRYPRLYAFLRAVQRIPRQTIDALKLAGKLLPRPLRRRFWNHLTGQPYCPPAGWVRWGHLRRLSPINDLAAHGRGTGIEQFYVRQFLAEHVADIRGHVLDTADDLAALFCRGPHVTARDTLALRPGQSNATLLFDLRTPNVLPPELFDCILLPSLLHWFDDVPAALRNLHRALKPGGILLAALPGLQPFSRLDADQGGQRWRFTAFSARLLFELCFPPQDITLQTYGNVLAATALLHGLAAEELREAELRHHDPNYPVILALRAVKSPAPSRP